MARIIQCLSHIEEPDRTLDVYKIILDNQIDFSRLTRRAQCEVGTVPLVVRLQPKGFSLSVFFLPYKRASHQVLYWIRVGLTTHFLPILPFD